MKDQQEELMQLTTTAERAIALTAALDAFEASELVVARWQGTSAERGAALHARTLAALRVARLLGAICARSQ